jgi:hypothetical protein
MLIKQCSIEEGCISYEINTTANKQVSLTYLLLFCNNFISGLQETTLYLYCHLHIVVQCCCVLCAAVVVCCVLLLCVVMCCCCVLLCVVLLLLLLPTVYTQFQLWTVIHKQYDLQTQSMALCH